MSTTYAQEESFKSEIIGNGLLEDAITWIKKNLSPEDVFDETDLVTWAEEKGYVIPEE